MPIMVLPLIYEAAAAAGGAVLLSEAKTRIERAINEKWRDYLAGALDGLGITIDPEQGITDESLTAAVNQNLLSGTGLELASLLDREKMMRGFERAGLQKVAGDLGLGDVSSVGEIRGAVQGWLVETVGAELASEAGELVDAAKPLPELAARLARVEPASNWNDARDFSAAGVSNRERQARYRAGHSKHWEDR